MEFSANQLEIGLCRWGSCEFFEDFFKTFYVIELFLLRFQFCSSQFLVIELKILIVSKLFLV